jgi:hypothetical protein
MKEAILVPRKLNMEEKRKLEKLLLADIESAETVYSTNRNKERAALEKQIEEKPPVAAANLMKTWVQAHDAKEQAEEALTSLGYRVRNYNSSEPELVVGGGHTPKVLEDFDKTTRTGREKLTGLKRDYTLKLFAGGDEAQEIFSSLTKDLAAISA